MKTNKTCVYGIFAVIIALTFAGCDNNPEPGHVHQWGEWDITAPATCIATGSQTRTCALNATHTETEVIPIDTVNGHDWGEWVGTVTCTEAGTGTRVCSRSESHIEERDDLQPLGHNYEWETKIAPTCTDEGEEIGTCTHDNSHTTTRKIAIDPTAHNWETGDDVELEPTCTTDGIGKRVCTLCEKVEAHGVLAALGHDWSEWEETILATCTEDGEKTATCTRDGSHITKQAIFALGHDYQWVTITPSLIEEGIDREICSRCADENGNTRNITSPFPITTTQEWNDARALLNGREGNYTLTINGDIAVGGTTTASFGTTASDSTLTVTLKGSGTLSLNTQGSIVYVADNQTLIIDSAFLKLEGLTNDKNGATQNNNNSAVYVNGSTAKLELRNGTISGNTASPTNNFSVGGGVYVSYGAFTMNGGAISGNAASNSVGWSCYGGGVYVINYGTFTMNGGEISGNTLSPADYNYSYGGGVYVGSYGTFTMTGGEISDNFTSGWYSNNDFPGGGGVYVDSNGTFTMTGGEISDNTVSNSNNSYGGGVYVNSNGTFTMTGGTISDNTGSCDGYNASGGGGVYVRGGTFTMASGEISGNTLQSYTSRGGGVRVDGNGTFRIVTGTIYGSNEGALSNTALGGSGAALYIESGTAQHGTFSGTGGEWVSSGDLSTTDDTIKVVNGVLH